MLNLADLFCVSGAMIAGLSSFGLIFWPKTVRNYQIVFDPAVEEMWLAEALMELGEIILFPETWRLSMKKTLLTNVLTNEEAVKPDLTCQTGTLSPSCLWIYSTRTLQRIWETVFKLPPTLLESRYSFTMGRGGCQQNLFLVFIRVKQNPTYFTRQEQTFNWVQSVQKVRNLWKWNYICLILYLTFNIYALHVHPDKQQVL